MNAVFSTATAKIFKYEVSDVVRSNWVIVYAAFFFAVTEAFFQFGGSSGSVMLSLMNVVLILVPLVCAIFGTIYLYNAREFTELMLSQPVQRSSLLAGLYTGLSVPLAASFLIGVSLPFALHGVQDSEQAITLVLMLAIGVLLTFVFVALAALIATLFQEKVKGLATSVLGWLFFAVLYDGLILLLVNAFAAYPLEKPMIGATLLNPVDLGRVLLMLQFDISALMGYTGAIFQNFFGSGWGMGLSFGALILWILVPLFFTFRTFQRRDF